MNKRNLSDLVIRQSEFKGEMGVARADITPPGNIPAPGAAPSTMQRKAFTARWSSAACSCAAAIPSWSSIWSVSTWAGGSTQPMKWKSENRFWKSPASATIS